MCPRNNISCPVIQKPASLHQGEKFGTQDELPRGIPAVPGGLCARVRYTRSTPTMQALCTYVRIHIHIHIHTTHIHTHPYYTDYTHMYTHTHPPNTPQHASRGGKGFTSSTPPLPHLHLPFSRALSRARSDFWSLAFFKSPCPAQQDRVLCAGQGRERG
jgi:hypothetical protein